MVLAAYEAAAFTVKSHQESCCFVFVVVVIAGLRIKPLRDDERVFVFCFLLTF